MESSLIRIAYSEDHIVVRNGICELLNSTNKFTIPILANNGKDLIEKLTKSKEKIDICILDVFMPVMDGYDALVHIRKQWPEMKVLVLTGHTSDFYLIKMIRAGANGYMQKSCSPQELETALVNIYEHGLHYSDVASDRFFSAVMGNKAIVPELTEKETQFLQLCCSDMSYGEIAQKMGVSRNSIDWYTESLFKKLNVHSRSSLVIWAIKYRIFIP